MVVEFFEVVVGGFRLFHVLVTTDIGHVGSDLQVTWWALAQ